MAHRLGFDIGGTFTDFFVIDDETGTVYREKISTTPENLADGVVQGVEKVYDDHADLSTEDVRSISHGTTVATNALIEKEGAKTGLITTDGFRDILAIGREDRDDIFEYSPEKTETFVPRRRRVTVDERVSASGAVRTPLSNSDVERAVAELLDADVKSIAVSLLNSYLNDEHERQVAEIARRSCDLPVSLSSDVMPEIKEYERTLSTVINAYIEPPVVDYVGTLRSELDRRGIDAKLYLMQADGGVVRPTDIENGRSLRLINSGPAGGVLGTQQFGKLAELDDIITLDMGGTSTDTSIIHDGSVELTTEGEISETGIPLLFPQIDIKTVGAGGGSIAWLDPSNRLRVGPKSAGARPGPACYGRGGTEPTVTDASLLLGYLNPEYFLGGEMCLDEAAARDVFESLAADLGEDVDHVAEGVLDIAAAKMKRAIRKTTIGKGYDPRDFVLACYGGAGPLFATRLAEELEIERALIPPTPGVLSAAGLVGADQQFNYSSSRPMAFHGDNAMAASEVFDDLTARAGETLDDATEVIRSVDLGYEDQGSYSTTQFPDGPITAEAIERTRERFDQAYESTYGYAYLEKPVEAVTWRVKTIEKTPDLSPKASQGGGSLADATKGTRDVYTDGTVREYTVYDRYDLPVGEVFEGPAIIEESESTVVVNEGNAASVDEAGNIVVVL